jgi:uncharacterized protein YidB (DUF937 family)
VLIDAIVTWLVAAAGDRLVRLVAGSRDERKLREALRLAIDATVAGVPEAQRDKIIRGLGQEFAKPPRLKIDLARPMAEALHDAVVAQLAPLGGYVAVDTGLPFYEDAGLDEDLFPHQLAQAFDTAVRLVAGTDGLAALAARLDADYLRARIDDLRVAAGEQTSMLSKALEARETDDVAGLRQAQLTERLGGPEGSTPSAPRPVTDWDALALGVHRPITGDSAAGQQQRGLTPYVLRAHDARLRGLLATRTQPVLVVLVGGSSTGKTRAAYEAVRDSLPDWSLLRPADAAELLAQLRDGAVSQRTVLWLNETQIFLRDQPEVAAALRRLLATDEPVAVIGTMWPRFWKELTSAPPEDAPDVHHQARELLLHNANRVNVPEVFSSDDLAALRREAATDRRLAAAAEAADSDGKVIQVLAGGPELVQRYEHPADAVDRYAKAVLTAAMDARRSGYESPLSRPFLEDAAPVYLDPPDRVGAPADWFATALDQAVTEVRGIAALSGHRDQPSVGPPDGYLLHDYLDQHARATRRGVLIPAVVWAALTTHALGPADRIRLAQAAQWRGLYRYAVDLARPAAEAGDTTAIRLLAIRLDEAGHAEEAQHWMQRAAEAGDPYGVQARAKRLDDSGDGEGAEAVLRTAAAAGDTSAILSLAGRFDQAGHREEAEQLLVQAAESGDTVVMGQLAARLDEAGQAQEAEQWIRRAAEAGDPIAMDQLAARLDEAGQAQEAEQWMQRAIKAGSPFTDFIRSRLAQRFYDTDRPDEAEAMLRQDIEAGNSSSMWILAARLDQADRAEEAKQLRQRARDAGEYFALWFAIRETEEAGGGLDDFERLLHPAAEAGDPFAMRTLAEKFDEAGRAAEANQWLSDSAQAGNLNALHVLAGRLEQANRTEEAEQVRRRIIEAGNSMAVPTLAQQIQGTDPIRADNLRRYGIEPGGDTAPPW